MLHLWAMSHTSNIFTIRIEKLPLFMGSHPSSCMGKQKNSHLFSCTCFKHVKHDMFDGLIFFIDKYKLLVIDQYIIIIIGR